MGEADKAYLICSSYTYSFNYCLLSPSLPSAVLTRRLGLPSLPLVPDDPERDDQAEPAGGEGDDVGGTVAGEPVGAGADAVVVDDGVGVEDGAVEEVEDVARDDRRQGHEAPVLAEAVDAERLGDDGRVHAEQEAVAEAAEPGHEAQQVRVRHVECEHLRQREDARRHHQAPNAAGVQHLDEEVGPDATKQAAREAADGQDGHVQLLAEHERLVVDRVVVVLPKCRDVVSDIATITLDHISTIRCDGPRAE